MRAAIYARVSTLGQAEGEVSIPDQIAQCRLYCKARGWDVARLFEDRGFSATTDNRPDFQAMLAEAKAEYHPFDVIVVHSQSRFARNLTDLLYHEKALDRAGVSLLSISQDFGDSDAAPMMRQMIGMFDEHQSRETSKHITRAMAENARQGFWNDSQPPLGYRTYVAETRGKKEKKKLEIDPSEAEIVKLVYDLYLAGDESSGPMGANRIAGHLNALGYKTRQRRTFSKQFVIKILRNEAYKGEYWFGKVDAKTKEPRPRSDWIKLDIPQIISPTTFEEAQEKLERQHPFKTPPRITTSNVLLTGLATCAICGNPLRIATGKGGKYRYYKCRTRLDTGSTNCPGCSVPEAKLDTAVTDALIDTALSAERLQTLLPPLIERYRNEQGERKARLRALKNRKTTHKQSLQRLYDLLSSGELDLDPVLKDKLQSERENIDQLRCQIARIEQAGSDSFAAIDQDKISQFAKAFRRRLRDDTNTAFRKAWLRTLVDKVDVGEKSVTISGKTSTLAAAVSQADKGVPSSAREWCG